MGSSMGRLFCISTWGESHGPGVGVVVDGCPPGIELPLDHIQGELDRRRPGQSKIVTPRAESDLVEVLSGMEAGKTTGAALAMWVRNTDQRPSAYSEMKQAYRPSHADYTYDAKYGIRSVSGGGRSSARETIGRVAAGAVAQRVLQQLVPEYRCVAYVKSVQHLQAEVPALVTRELVDGNMVRTCDPAKAVEMIAAIEAIRTQGNSLGGVIECQIHGVPAGLGEPVFDKLEADLAKAMMSLPASKGFEIGSGFAGTLMTGLEHNDAFYMDQGKVRTRSNHSGGIQGGISNGETIVFRVAFKPVATVLREQQTVNREGEDCTLKARGRHDPCVLPRAVPMVEAMAHLVVVDHLLRQRGQCGSWSQK